MTTKVNNRMIDGAVVSPVDFGAVGDGVANDAPAIQAAIDYAVTVKMPVRLSGKYRIGNTINLRHQTSIDASGAAITVDAGIGTLFLAQTNGSVIEAVDIVGGSWTESSSASEGTVTFLTQQGEYNAANTHIYVNRFNIQRVRAYNFEWFMESDWGRSWNVDNCFIYGKNGLRLQHKNVECNITNCIIFGTDSSNADTRGVSIGENMLYPGEGRYPEGIKIHNCTIDNFGRALSVHEILDLSVTDNWLGCSVDPTMHNVAFEQDSGNFFVGLHFNHNTYFKGRIEFISHAAPPTQTFIQMSDEIYLQSQVIVIGNSWHDVVMEGWVFQQTSPTPQVGITCSNDNQRCHFKDMVFKGAHSGLIQVNGTTSIGCSISNVWGDSFIDDPFFLQSPVMVTGSAAGKPDGSTANLGQYIYTGRLTSANQGDDLALLPVIKLRAGALVELCVQGLLSSSLANGTLQLTQSSQVLEPMVKGAGWDSQFIEITNQDTRVDTTITYRVTSNDDVSLALTSITGDTTASFHSNISLRYV